MTENEQEEPAEPTFRVERGDELLLLVPQFQPSDLSDDEREVYDALRDAGAGHHAGAIGVNELAESRFEGGETVGLLEVVDRYMAAANEFAEQLSDVFVDIWESLAPVMRDIAEAMQPIWPT